jgi:hypothetical protein
MELGLKGLGLETICEPVFWLQGFCSRWQNRSWLGPIVWGGVRRNIPCDTPVPQSGVSAEICTRPQWLPRQAAPGLTTGACNGGMRFWGDNFHATLVEDGAYLWRCLCYIELNMVRCGRVAHPREWDWLGYPEIRDWRPSSLGRTSAAPMPLQPHTNPGASPLTHWVCTGFAPGLHRLWSARCRAEAGL